MPRKLFKIGESMPAPSERPGSGSPDDSGIRRKPRREEPTVVVEAGYQKEVDAEKLKRAELKRLQGKRKEIDAARRKAMATLRSHGLGTVSDIEAELSDMSPELRAKSLGQRPSFGYRIGKIFRTLAGMERPPEAKQALQSYLELEQLGQANRLALSEAEAPKAVPETAELHTQIEQLKRQEEQKTDEVAKLRRVWETAAEIEETLNALNTVEDDVSVAMDWDEYQRKQNAFSARIRKLESGGTSEEYDQALQKAEDALARYVVALHRRRPEATQTAARTAGKGETRPDSKIGVRPGRAGGYGTSRADRREVGLVEKELPDSSKRDLAAERMKEVMEYRSKPAQAKLLAEINKEPAVRAKMHAIYEAFSARWKQLQKDGNEKAAALQTSIDPALDYALNVYQAFARDNGQFVFSGPERTECLKDVRSANADLGWGTDENLGEDMFALLKIGPPRVSDLAERSVKSRKERAKKETAEEAEPIPLTRKKEPIPLTRKKAVKVEEPTVLPHIKRALSEQELEEVRETLDVVETPVEEKPSMVEKRTIRRTMQYAPTKEARQARPEKTEPSVPLADAERIRMREALNAKFLAMRPARRDQDMKKIMRRFGRGETHWMDVYINLYEDYLTTRDAAAKDKLRERLAGLNQLLMIEDPRDLLAGESPSVREAIHQAMESNKPAESIKKKFARPLSEPPKQRSRKSG